MNGKNLTYEERLKIEAWLQADMKIAWIAEQLGVSRQTIYTELERGKYVQSDNGKTKYSYSAGLGQKNKNISSSLKGRSYKIKGDCELLRYIENKILVEGYSPKAALIAAKNENFETQICLKTLYSYIDKGVFPNLSKNDLWSRNKKRKRFYRIESTAKILTNK